LRDEREHLIEQVTEAETNAFDQRFQVLRSRRDSLNNQRELARRNVAAQQRRVEELRQQLESVDGEMARLKRVRKADSILSGIKVTHCPVCELPAQDDNPGSDICYLCGKKHSDASASADNRLDFELDQLKEEHDELTELIDGSNEAIKASEIEIEMISAEINDVDADLKPAVRFAMTNVPPDLAVIDLRLGRLNEQLSQLARVEQTLQEQTKLSEAIAKLEAEIEQLRTALKEAHAEVNFRQLSQILGDGMNSYLNALNEAHSGLWSKGWLNVELRARSFNVTIHESAINTELGATSNAIALFAFHYALLQLSVVPGYHYPGLVILDFPLTLASGEALKDAENYLMEPFIKLLQTPAFAGCQLIAAGRAFEGLVGAKQIELDGAY
jgi:peptidoglycan hydrolase CwlO-like protein